MRGAQMISVLFALSVSLWSQQASQPTPKKRLVIAASVVFDGRGQVLHNTRIVVEDGRIVALSKDSKDPKDPKAGPVDYDLRGLTVMPGWIDAHVHLNWFFGKDGKLAGADASPAEAAFGAAENAWAMLMAGFTTVQSVGSPKDLPLREAIARS